MKKTFALLLAFLALLLIGACGAEEPLSSTSPSIEVPSSSPSPEPSKEPVVYYSPTTGMAFEQRPDYLPIAVMVENQADARPQTGLQQADIIYEAMAEGDITRFMCIYNDNKPTVVGPIRSARLYYINMQKEWDAPLVHYGGPDDSRSPSYIYGDSTDYIKVRVDGVKGAYSDYFWRDKSRSAPHNVYTDLVKIQEELYDYTPNPRTQFSFDEDPGYGGQTVDTISLPYVTDTEGFVTFEYDSVTDKFYRYEKGKAFEVRTVTEDADGEQTTVTQPLTVQNLIVQYAETYVRRNDGGRRMVEMVGQGDCEFFIGGKHISGYWERESLDDSTQYYAGNGLPIILKPGNTWIAVHPDNREIGITYVGQ